MRWKLTVIFDGLRQQEEIDPELAFPEDETSRYIAYLGTIWGCLPEELQDDLDWSTGVITAHSDTVEVLASAMNWVAMHTVPISVHLTRFGPR
jgi:hypothetical protein